ncbi:RNA polymerase ECF-type sigma factor, putative [Pedobacter sp. BAL39]|uniref:RNA polymerase sigma factor n=1 Tax=Pedobacter sp. BAL39 TaxID=391596 RepID=UPI000155AD61|nr:RNA polymerase sigma-70 factor [Pedobacter sp. BAL39]EDM34732.1 RNA polymerase ECF-type sigma factor, putative [Pedobacter sp. BAL39]
MSEYKNLPDQELIGLLSENTGPVFNEVYNRYWSQLFLHVRRMLGDDELAKDIVQEVFTNIWERSPDFSISTSLSSYLYTAVRNRVFNEIKQQKVKSVHLQDIAAFFSRGQYEADEALRYQQLKSAIELEISKMPEKMREIFELSRHQYLSHKQIAALMNISEHTVRTQVQRALRLLRQKIDLPVPTLFFLAHLLK